MARKSRGEETKESSSRQASAPKNIRKRRDSTPRVPQALLERIRQLMERTIEFVDHPIFALDNATEQIEAMRPASVELEPELTQVASAIAFIPSLVQSPLLTCEEERYWFTWMNFLKYRAEHHRQHLDLSHPDRSLIKKIDADLKQSMQVRNHIIQGNVRLIVALGRKMAGSLEQMSDLIGEGMTPLIRSVELFDISRGYRFSTYATWAVRNQMLRFLKRLRLSQENIFEVDSFSLQNIKDKSCLIDPTAHSLELKVELVGRMLSTLSERERSLIAARFGLDGQPKQSLAEIAQKIGLSRERARQIVLAALSKLRIELSEEESEQTPDA